MHIGLRGNAAQAYMQYLIKRSAYYSISAHVLRCRASKNPTWNNTKFVNMLTHYAVRITFQNAYCVICKTGIFTRIWYKYMLPFYVVFHPDAQLMFLSGRTQRTLMPPLRIIG